MKKALLIHGAYGNSSENWFPWLRNELINNDYKVISPDFPTPLDHNFNNWEFLLKSYINDIDNNTVVIAHSVGVLFILNIIQKYELQIKSLFFISGFVKPLNDHRFDEINKTFFKDIKWDKINQYSPQVNIYHSDNDPYVDKSHAMEISKNIPSSQLTIIKQAGHFNEESGFNTFPQLLEDILSS